MIRPATLDDVPAIVDLGVRFLSSSYADRMVVNPAQLAAISARLIAQDDGAMFVAEQEGTVIGMIGLVVYAHHLSAERTVGEVCWYVDPAARGAGVKLLRTAERWAVAQGATRMQMVAPSAKVGAFYEKVGYEPIEWAYQKAVGGPAAERVA